MINRAAIRIPRLAGVQPLGHGHQPCLAPQAPLDDRTELGRRPGQPPQPRNHQPLSVAGRDPLERVAKPGRASTTWAQQPATFVGVADHLHQHQPAPITRPGDDPRLPGQLVIGLRAGRQRTSRTR